MNWPAVFAEVVCLEEAAGRFGVDLSTVRAWMRRDGVKVPEGMPATWAGVRQALRWDYLDWLEARRQAKLTEEQRATMTLDEQARRLGIPADDVHTAYVRARPRRPRAGLRRWGKGSDPLTPDEAAMLEDIEALGLSNARDAAGRLGVSLRTIERLKKRAKEAAA